MRSCAANALECEEVLYFCVTVWDLVLSVIGSLRFWIAWVGHKFAVSMLDLVRLAIGSWSSAELIFPCVFFGIMSTFCYTEPLEVMAVWFSWPPLEVGVGYLAGSSCIGMSGEISLLCGLDSIVCPFVNIALTASIAANCESRILVGTSLSAAVKKMYVMGHPVFCCDVGLREMFM